MVERVTSSLNVRFSKNKSYIDSSVNCRWAKNISIKTNVRLVYLGSDKLLNKDSITAFSWGKLSVLDNITAFSWGKLSVLDNITDTSYFNILPYKDIGCNFGELKATYNQDAVTNTPYFNILPYKDIIDNLKYHHTYVFDNRPLPPVEEIRYVPSLDFTFNTSETLSFKGDFIAPLNYDKLKVRMSPLDSVTSYPWGIGTIADIKSQLKWGYGINDFVIGGAKIDYYVDDDALIGGSPIVPITERVIKFVNVVNIVTLPARTPIDFYDFQLNYDVESVAWNFSITVPNKITANLIKPSLLSVVELEVSINGEIFLVFISKTNTTRSVDDSGKITQRIKCTGNSVHKLLSAPYAVKSSFTETSVSTPAGILNSELIGTGFTATWSCPSWSIPANTYSYIDKSKLAGISELVTAIGGVIIPKNDTKEIEILPRYPISPWQWSVSSATVALNEGNFFSIDTDWIPQESPDSIHIFGDNDNGVAVKCVKNGTAGVKTLPSISNKYMTDNIPATERGRIEVAKNGFIESIPISTFVDPNIGILKPLTLVEVTELDGVTAWKGLVVSVRLNLKRNGNALVQTIVLERHYDVI